MTLSMTAANDTERAERNVQISLRLLLQSVPAGSLEPLFNVRSFLRRSLKVWNVAL